MNKPVLLADLLTTRSITADAVVSDKKALIRLLSAQASTALKLEEHEVFDVLWEREKLGTTGVGDGIAIPHGRIEGLEKVSGFFVRLASPIGFDSIDGHPVDLVFLLLAPESAGADHLHALASVSRTLRDAALCGKLRKARDSKTLYSILTGCTPAVAA